MSPGVHLIVTRLRAPILALGGVSVVGTLGYRLLEGWNWLDAAWMVAITLTTIGYGEVHPLSPVGRLFTMALIGVGVGVATWALGQAAGYALSGDLQREFESARQEQRLEALKGHMVVAGYGRTGQEVAADLAHAGVVVVVIDLDPQACAAARAAGHLAVHGDATSDAILRTAGIERAVGLAATSASDAVNVFVVLSARQFSASLRILARVDHAENEAKARHAGADGVVRPHAIGGTPSRTGSSVRGPPPLSSRPSRAGTATCRWRTCACTPPATSGAWTPCGSASATGSSSWPSSARTAPSPPCQAPTRTSTTGTPSS